MKKLFLCVLLMSCALQNVAAANNNRLVQAIDLALSASCLDDQQTAISIVSLPDGKPVYQHHVDIPLLPASTMKVVTTSSALNYLGAEYKFKTELLAQGSAQGGVIYGDLVLRGGGDPSLRTEDLWTMARHLRYSGIKRVQGNLRIDTSFFDADKRAPSWTAQSSQKPWDANIGALTLNLNNLILYVQPGENIGDPVNAWVEPPTLYLRLDNKAQTVGAKAKNKNVWATRQEDRGGLVINLRGNMLNNSAEQVFYLNVPDPVSYTAAAFREQLEAVGIQITGDTLLAPAENNASMLYTHLSEPLFVILKELNTYSNNVIAEQVLKTIAAETYGKPGTHEHGLQMNQMFLHRLGIDTAQLHLADGSGLSRENRFTAGAMTDLLHKMLLRFDIGPDFLALLRVLGNPESSSKRMKKSPAKGQVRAKTGTLNGVSTLVGYVPGKNGRLFAYAFFLNNNRCGYSGADSVEDKIINALFTLEEGDNSNPPPLSALVR